jgi:multiple sugar transport system ATP-binding protein
LGCASTTIYIEEEGRLLAADEGGFKIEVPAGVAERLKSREGKSLVFGVRPEDLALTEKEEPGRTFRAEIQVVEPLGAEIHLYAKTENQSLIARVPPHRGFKVGDALNFSPNPDKVIFFDPETGKALFS